MDRTRAGYFVCIAPRQDESGSSLLQGAPANRSQEQDLQAAATNTSAISNLTLKVEEDPVGSRALFTSRLRLFLPAQNKWRDSSRSRNSDGRSTSAKRNPGAQ